MCLLDRWVADVGDWSMGDECNATVPTNQRRSHDARDYDHLCRFNAAADCCHWCRRRHQKQTAPASTGQTYLLFIYLLAKTMLCSIDKVTTEY